MSRMPNYRAQLVHHLPTLVTVDTQAVSCAERKEASATVKKEAPLQVPPRSSPKFNLKRFANASPHLPLSPLSACASKMRFCSSCWCCGWLPRCAFTLSSPPAALSDRPTSQTLGPRPQPCWVVGSKPGLSRLCCGSGGRCWLYQHGRTEERS